MSPAGPGPAQRPDTADRYLDKLRALVDKVEASQHPLHPDEVLSADQMAALAVEFASVATLLDSALTLGYAPMPADWQPPARAATGRPTVSERRTHGQDDPPPR